MPSLGHLSWKRSVKFHNFPLLRVNVFFLFLSTIAPALVYVSTRAPVNSNLGCGYSCLCLLCHLWEHKGIPHFLGGLPTLTTLLCTVNSCWECSWVSMQSLPPPGEARWFSALKWYIWIMFCLVLSSSVYTCDGNIAMSVIDRNFPKYRALPIHE